MAEAPTEESVDVWQKKCSDQEEIIATLTAGCLKGESLDHVITPDALHYFGLCLFSFVCCSFLVKRTDAVTANSNEITNSVYQ